MKRPLKRHTVTWRYAGEDTTRTVSYFGAQHHDDRDAADAANDAVADDLRIYADACETGQAVIVAHATIEEVPDGA